MLDLFLEAAYTKTKQAELQSSMQSALEALPVSELMAITRGESSLNKVAYHLAGGDDPMCWLEHFQGTALYDEALAIEKRQLELDMQQNADQQRSQTVYNERDVLRVKRKMLELQLAEQNSGAAEVQAEAPEAAPPAVAETAAPAPSGEGAANVAKTADAAHISDLIHQGLQQGAGRAAKLKPSMYGHIADAPKAGTKLKEIAMHSLGGGGHPALSGGFGAKIAGKILQDKPAFDSTAEHLSHSEAVGRVGGALGGGIAGFRHGPKGSRVMSTLGGALAGGAAGGSAFRTLASPAALAHSSARLDKEAEATERFKLAAWKLAFNPMQAFKNVGQLGLHAAKANPALAGAALGAAGGAVAGGPGHRLSGAVGGAAVGGAAGFAAPKIRQGMQNGLGFGEAAKATGQAGLNQMQAMGGNAMANMKAKFMTPGAQAMAASPVSSAMSNPMTAPTVR